MRYFRLNNRAQALVEMAIFGSVMLFALSILVGHGMNHIQQQEIRMQGFRKGFVRASTKDATTPRGTFDPGWEFENTEAPAASNHWGQSNYVVIEDKPIVAVGGILPIVERSPMGMGVEALRSIDLFAGAEGYPNDPNNPNDPAMLDLPRTEFEINGRRYSFTVAGFNEYSEGELGTLYQKQDIEGWSGVGTSWQWVEVEFADLAVHDAVDVDDDLYEEYVVGIDHATGIIQVTDYQEGEINYSEPLVAGAPEAGGLEEDYTRELQVAGDSNFRRQETPGGITTTDHINSTETFHRIITLTDGEYPVDDELIQQETRTWTTSH